MNISQKKERTGLMITIIQLLVLTLTFSRLRFIHNPLFSDYLGSITCFGVLSLITILIYKSRYNISSYKLLIGFTLSKLGYDLFIIRNYVSPIFFISCSYISGLILTLKYKYFTRVGYITVNGILRYFYIEHKYIINIVTYLWSVEVGLTWAFLCLYICTQTFLCIVLSYLGIVLAYKKIYNQLILRILWSFVYYLIVVFIDKLLIFNLSLKDRKLFRDIIKDLEKKDINNKIFKEHLIDFNKKVLNNDKDSLITNKYLVNHKTIHKVRFFFHHLSSMTYKYSVVVNSVLSSKLLLEHILNYIKLEFNLIKQILKEIRNEHHIYDTKLYMTVPQTNSTIKRFRNYSVIDKNFYKLIYLIKLYLKRYIFMRDIQQVENINKFMMYIEDFKDRYLLVEDFSRNYTSIYKELIDDIRETEEVCKIDMKVKVE